MKNNYNTLHQYILDNSIVDYHRETVNGLFRSVLEPVASNQSFEACIVFRLFDVDSKLNIIKRLGFSNSNVFSFSDVLSDIPNIEKENIWGKTEFVLVIGSRYSACLMWDYSLSERKDYTPVLQLYNSSLITSIAKKISDNASEDIKKIILKFIPDRRENKLLNMSVNSISAQLNAKNEEVLFSQIEKEQFMNSNDELKTASIVADKSKFIAHEIKNSLSVINLYSTISQKRLLSVSADKEVMDSLKNSIENIMRASENISAHINDLRCLSTPFISEFSIKKSIKSVVDQCNIKAKNSNVCIILSEFDDKLINSDKVKFECSLLNVIYNAVEACEKGGEIQIKVIFEGNIIYVQVKNNGEKIPDSLINEIFKSNFTTKKQGNGLGLAICKKQLQLIGGDIKLVYSNDEETLFEITLIV